ncbi:MAG: flagellar basal body-associated FliL family protein [Treponema sp.]|nr:flagellar basal body-associated FliL family protein [Treponema sp.]
MLSKAQKLYRGLLICLMAMGLIIIGGTLYAVIFRPASGKAAPMEAAPNAGDGAPFTGIGPLRVAVKPDAKADTPTGTVIVFAIFTYYPEDKAFSEELALRVKDFREIIINYVGGFSADELQKQGEENLKAEILRRFNSILRLGKIDALIFNEFMIIG